MVNRPARVFSETVNGTIWQLQAVPETGRLYLEIRDPEARQVSFSSLDATMGTWIWKEVMFDEKWWISLAAATPEVLLFTLYTDVQNPDKKALIAADAGTGNMIWWRNDFSVSTVAGSHVSGVTSKFGVKPLILDVHTGNELPGDVQHSETEQNFTLVCPFQYREGTTHFETVRAFLQSKAGITPVLATEYCEYGSWIIISAFCHPEDLANYLIVFDGEGDIVLQETLGEHLKGIAQDTFFIFQGSLIFVKNKRELVSYRLV